MEMTIIDKAVLNELFIRINSLQKKLDSLYENSGLKPKVWMTNEEACFRLNASKGTMMTLRKGKILPYTKLGRKVFYRTTDIENMLTGGYKQRIIKP